ncbi:hypothetical protein V6Z12_D11G051300 [Gossypium hirsutum]
MGEYIGFLENYVKLKNSQHIGFCNKAVWWDKKNTIYAYNKYSLYVVYHFRISLFLPLLFQLADKPKLKTLLLWVLVGCLVGQIRLSKPSEKFKFSSVFNNFKF